MDDFASLTQLSDDERENATRKYQIIEPYINGEQLLKKIAEYKSIPIRTLNLWVRKYRTHGLVGLARQSRCDKGLPRQYEITLQKLIEGIYLKKPMLSGANIHKLITVHCHKKNLKVPSYRSVCRVIFNIPDDLLLLGRQGTKAYQQQYDLLYLRAANQPNELWQADHVLLDFEVLNDKNKLQRPWLTVVIDDCSRAICGYELSFLSPSANKTSLCFRHAIWRKSDPNWGILGIPESFYTDHGSDFTSKHIEQVCIDLKVRLIFSQVGQPRGRGKIERFFRTLNQKIIHTLQAATQIGTKSKHMDIKSLDAIIYAFIIEYNHTIHPEINLKPAARWQLNGFIPQLVDSLEYLDLLLLTEAKPRKILRDGIRFQGLRYIDTLLAEYVGEHVVIRYVPSDITSIRVFYKERFLCQPICRELSQLKVGLKEIQHARNQRRRKLKKEIVERKSLVDAVIEASSIYFQSSEESESPLLPTESKQNKLKIYKNE
ncbi:MAG: DDE-type integrase/transposase/recombinase [Tatlockia sp.]|nr:DDE-type integrase/transposase/recombinase [Tatlockia sp.]